MTKKRKKNYSKECFTYNKKLKKKSGYLAIDMSSRIVPDKVYKNSQISAGFIVHVKRMGYRGRDSDRGRTDGWTDEWINGWMGGWVDRLTDR